MYEIARQLGISKKTLYLLFKDKNDILLKTANHHITQTHSRMLEPLHEAKDPIHELILVSQRTSSVFAKLSEVL
jgi:TetR/AcrR family transcriptional regulator, cholesterol catabolism regulator